MTSHIFRLLFEFTGPCIWRETRVVRILDGTSEIMRQIIARNAFGNRDGGTRRSSRQSYAVCRSRSACVPIPLPYCFCGTRFLF
ncbi:acyl-CoA dehydrogenase family protein [Bradyrhizobium sp. USDA 4461]